MWRSGHRRGRIRRLNFKSQIKMAVDRRRDESPLITSTTPTDFNSLFTMSNDAAELDRRDPLAWTRDEFELPLRKDSGAEGESCPSVATRPELTTRYAGEGELVYLCGNSLGLLPKKARTLMQEELDVWSKRCVQSRSAS